MDIHIDEPVTFTCVLPDDDLSRTVLYWYKQSAGDNLKLIVRMKKNLGPVYSSGFPASQFEERLHKNISTLTILRTTEEDEGMYHCAVVDSWTKNHWSGTYLSLKGNLVIFLQCTRSNLFRAKIYNSSIFIGNSERTSNYTVVQTVSDPVRPGDSATLQCSVLSDSDNKTCPGDHSVYWFRAGSNTSHPEIIYTGGNNECEKRSDAVKCCVYRFSKNVSSSDAGTYYCAVATCGQILFGNGTNLQFAIVSSMHQSPGMAAS
uniref:Ig-like domain-containing protein n=1 Tax=Anabas testudineus TaxID=64144 RepID=A0A7N5ZYZ6_ANATE